MKLDLSAGVEVDIKIWYVKVRINSFKIGNSSHFQDNGNNTVTILKVDECVVLGVKTIEKNGYNAVQIASIDTDKDISNIKKPQRKIFSSTI